MKSNMMKKEIFFLLAITIITLITAAAFKQHLTPIAVFIGLSMLIGYIEGSWWFMVKNYDISPRLINRVLIFTVSILIAIAFFTDYSDSVKLIISVEFAILYFLAQKIGETQTGKGYFINKLIFKPLEFVSNLFFKN